MKRIAGLAWWLSLSALLLWAQLWLMVPACAQSKMAATPQTLRPEDAGLAVEVAPVRSMPAGMPVAEVERLAIQRRHLAASPALAPTWQQVVRRIAPYLAVLIVFLAILLRSHYQLRREMGARLLAQQKLQAQLDFQRRLLDAIPIPIAVKDTAGHYLEINAAFQSVSGLAREQMTGHLPADLNVLGKHVADALQAGVQQAVASRQLHRLSVDFLGSDDLLHHFLVWAQPITGAGEEITSVVSAAVDVTEIRHAEAKARAAEARLVGVTSLLPATVFQMRERDGSMKFLWVSGNAQQLFDRSPESLLGQIDALLGVLNPEDRSMAVAAADQAKVKDLPLSRDMRILVRGKTRWVRVHAVPQLEPNGSYLWHGYFADLTEDRERAEALAEAKTAAEAASRAKDSFLAMMSHEIRTPMNGILGLIELLQTTTLTAEQQRMLALASESGQALAHILDDLLDYAKLEAGRLAILRAPADLRALFDGVLGALLPQAFQKGLRLRQTVGSAVPALVEVDGIRMRQILFNLLGNAIKFTRQGSVSLRASIEVNESGTMMVVVTVEDTGIGIAKDALSRLFEPFVQGELTTTRRFGGTGLGLFICRKLAELMDGEVSLSSTEGVGTTAVLRVPCELVRREYDIPTLRRRALSLQVADDSTRAALVAFAEAAGMRCLGPDEELPPDGAIIADSGFQVNREGRLPIHLAEDLLPLGYRQDGQRLVLGNNPLRWTAFIGALEEELGIRHGLPTPFPPSVSGDEGRASAPQGARILIVEDHFINREVIQQQLRLLGYRGTVRANGQEAMDALSAGTYDLVLADFHMPVMDGFELTRAIRASDRPAVRALPVVGLTATIAREEHQRCLEVGMNGLVVKPASLASLHQAIEAALHGGPSATLSEKTVPQLAQALPSPCSAGKGGFCPERIDRNALLAHLDGMLPGQNARQIVQRALADDRASLRTHLAEPSPARLREWGHRASGGLSTLEQPYLVALVHRLSDLCQDGSPADIQDAGASVLAMYDYLLELTAPPGVP